MAEAILGADHAGRKPASSDITTPIDTGLQCYEVSAALAGLVADPLVDLDTQIAVLALVDETGSASMGDLISILQRHEAPAQAIGAMLRLGVLVVEPGLIDAQSLVSRRVQPVRARPSFADQVNHRDRGKVHHLQVLAPEPDIFFAIGIDRNYFVTEARLRQRGIYFAIYCDGVYVGRSGDTACRIAWGAHLRRHGLPERIIAAVDRKGALSEAQMRACERLAARRVVKETDLALVNDTLPVGDRLGPIAYAGAAGFVDTVFERVLAAGLFGSDAHADVPAPVTEPDLEQEPGMESVFSLDACGIRARARQENGKWIVLAGSQVRPDPAPSSGSAPFRLRTELLHEGGLVTTGDVLVLTEDLAFDTAVAAGCFVAGSRVRAGAWKPIPAEPTAPPRP
ncbi:hypothetical protein [Devosia sp. CAU 1758]